MLIQKYNQGILKDAMSSPRIAVDTETVGLVDKTMIGFSIAYEKNNKIIAHYIPVRHNKFANMPLGDVQRVLKQILHHDQLIFHNYTFDAAVFEQFGMPVKTAIIHDTMIIAHLLDENSQQGLKPLALRYCGHKMQHFKDICGTGKKQILFADVKKAIATSYASEDAEYTYKLFNLLYPRLIKDEGLNKIYHTIEQPLLQVVADMQIEGITVDKVQVEQIREKCQKQVSKALEWIEYVMPGVNLNSPKQLREYFVDKKHLTPLKVSKKTRQPCVDKEFFEHHAGNKQCPEIDYVLKYRKYNKILSTFVPALTPLVGNKIYAKFRQSGTTSGRFSSSNPNMCNIPRTNEEFDIRAAVIAEKGHTLIGADYSQIELRLAAHCSQDPIMLAAYTNKLDIHQLTADTCGSTRQEAKTINFGLLYGMYWKTLAKQLGVSPVKGMQFHNNFWKEYSVLNEFILDAKTNAITNGYTETIFGRKRHLTNIFDHKEPFQKGAELRSLANAIIQGSGADLMKLAMIDAYQPLKNIGGKIILTVYDELLISVPISKKEEGVEILTAAMLKQKDMLSVPLEIDLKVGESWSACHG